MSLLTGKVVAITGSGRGLGRAYAESAAAAGAQVVVHDIDADVVDEVVQLIRDAGGQAHGVVSSVADWEGAAALVDQSVQVFGRLDGLVNNAGLFRVAEPHEETEDNLRAMVDVNVLGPLFVGTLALRQMVKQGSGTVINVTSGAHLGIAKQGVYGASKGAMASLTYSWAMDMARHGIRVNAVSPLALTRMVDEYLMPGVDRNALPDPASIAPMVVFALSDRADFTGQVLRLDGRTFSLLDQPTFNTDSAVEAESWTAERLADAWDEKVSRYAERGGMQAYRTD